MAVHGRGGDIVMSMGAAGVIGEVTGDLPAIVVHDDYREVAELLVSMGMPISSVLTSSYVCKIMDRRVFGSSVSRWSNSLLSSMYGDEDVFNCCIGSVPSGVHLSSYMQYMTGLVPDIPPPSCPSPDDGFICRGGSGSVVYHLGGSDAGKHVFMESDPFPGLTSVIVGSGDDPYPRWGDVDMRGCSLREVCDALVVADACIGSDSMITHISSVMRVNTVAIHFDEESIGMSSRSYAPMASSILCKRGNTLDESVIGILSEHISF